MEKATLCPKCKYKSSDGEEFTTCPQCGLIIKKFYETQKLKEQMEQERLKKKKEQDIKDQQEYERLTKRRQRIIQEEEKLKQRIPSHLQSLANFSFFASIGLLVIGLLNELSDEIYKFHISQTLYYYSGVCFIVSAILFGVRILLGALNDLHKSIKDYIQISVKK